MATDDRQGSSEPLRRVIGSKGKINGALRKWIKKVFRKS